MKWRGRRGSGNIEDRRGSRGARAGSLGLGGMLVVLAVGYFFGIDVSPIVGGGGSAPLDRQDQEWGEFVSVVLADTEEIWASTLPEQAGIAYADPTLVLFSGVVQSACGGASSAMGPFYCPGDRKIYLDTDFFDLMRERMNAGGDFAAAYVVAHEVGHHVQNLTGVLSAVNRARSEGSETRANQISVRAELQADCYAGLWARRAQDRFGTLEQGDIQEALGAAHAVGDDVIQSSAGTTPMPDSFTHGTAEQRQTWFLQGFRSGDMRQCDTFSVRTP